MSKLSYLTLTALTLTAMAFAPAVQAAPPPATDRGPVYSPPRAPDRIAQVSALIGLSEAEIRELLYLRPVHHAYLSAIEHAGGVETRILSARDLAAAGGLCERWSGVSIHVVGDQVSKGMASFVFSHGLLTDVRSGEVTAGQGARLEVFCYRNREKSPGYVLPAMVLYSPFIVIDALGRAPKIVKRLAGLEALTGLRLGAAPPGGLAVYRQQPPGPVTVRDQPDGSAVITVELAAQRKRAQPDRIRFTVRDDVITVIAKDTYSFTACALTPDRSWRCDLPR